MSKSLLTKGEDFEKKQDYFRALDCYLKIWSEKLYVKDTFKKAEDEIRSIKNLGNKIVIGSRDERLYLFDRSLQLKKSLRIGGKIRSIKAAQSSEKTYLLVVTGQENRAIQGEKDYELPNTIVLFDDKLTYQEQAAFQVPNDEKILTASFINIKNEELKIVVGTNRGNIYLFDLCSNHLDTFDIGFNQEITTVTGIDYDNDGNDEIITSGNNNLFIINVKTKEKKRNKWSARFHYRNLSQKKDRK